MNTHDLKSALRLRLLLGLLIGIAAGYGVGRSQSAPIDVAPEPEPVIVAETAIDAADEEQLHALGYSPGSEPMPAASGITRFEPDAAYTALNLFTSGHAPGAFLMTMDGRVVHEWRLAFDEIWPDTDPGEQSVDYWRRVHVFENGDVLAIFEPHGIFRVDKDSNLLWKNYCGAHHDLIVEPDGRIFVLAREEQRLQFGSDPEPRPVLEDYVLELDADGNEVRRVSLLKALQNSTYDALLYETPTHWDVLHTNSVKRIPAGFDSDVPALAPGRFLLSLRDIHAIAVLDFEMEQVVWALKGQWRAQHEATLVDDGNILLFDNQGNRGRSKAVEFDPATQEIAWAYGMRDDEPLNSVVCGLAQRLPNGNTLVTEGVPGRVIEVTRDNEVVWEYVNPNAIKPDAEIVASLMDFQRLPQSFTPRWLDDNERGGGE